MIDSQRGAWLRVLALILNAQNGADDNMPDDSADQANKQNFVKALGGGVAVKAKDA